MSRIRQLLVGLLSALLLCGGAGAQARPFITAGGIAVDASILPPTITGLTGRMVQGDWVAGSQTTLLSATAATGISHVAVLVDADTVADRYFQCNSGQSAPCPDLSNEPLTVDTRKLSDGWHHVMVRVTDAVGQTTSSSNYLFGVSNTPPGPVGSLHSNISSASGWSRMAEVGLGWQRQTADPAPIAQTFFTIDQGPSSTDGTSLPGDPLHMNLTPADGPHTVWVWQEDAAGNVGLSSARSIEIKIDRTPPTLGTAQLSNQNRTLQIAVSDAGSGFASILSADAVDVGPYDPYFGDDLPLSASKHGGTILLSLPAAAARGRWEIQAKTADALGNTGLGRVEVGIAFPAPPMNQSLPTISGQATVGSTLTVDPGTWTNEPSSYSYLWERCGRTGCAPIGGATGPSFPIDSGESGYTLRALVVAANLTSGGQALSAATVPVPPSASSSSRTNSGPTSGPQRPSATALTGVQQDYLSAAAHGISLARRYWGNRRYHWYNLVLNDPKRYPQATIWDIFSLFESVDEVAIASPTTSHRQAVTRFANHAEIYWDPHLKPGPGYVPYPGSKGVHTKTFFDDNSVLGLAFMDAYRATGNTRYLVDAERAMGFVLAFSWDQSGGGMWWNTWHSACPQSGGTCRQTTTHHTELLGVATDLAAELYQATGNQLYLQTAEKYIIWANQHLLKWDGSYTGHVPHEQIMPHDGEGALIAAFTTLCQSGVPVPSAAYAGLPRNSFHANPSVRRPAEPTSWCSWAESVAYKTAFGIPVGQRVYDPFVPLNEGPQWDTIYVGALLRLYSYDRNPRWYTIATATASRILRNAADGSGRFLKAWNGSSHVDEAYPGMLRTHASSVSVLADLAASSPPAG